jgi:dCMP deaminase
MSLEDVVPQFDWSWHKARQAKWDARYIELARHVAQWSKDPSTKAGAVIIAPNGSVVSVGYNGFAKGVQDTDERLNDRETKYKMVVHCERNAIIFAQRDLTGCTLYTWPFMSCGPCAGMVIQAGIKRCVAPRNDNPRWQEDFRLAQQQFTEAGVTMDFTDPVV